MIQRTPVELIQEPTAPEAILPPTGAGHVNVGGLERALSAAGGLLLIGWGAGRAATLRLSGLVLMAAGVPLVVRGATGHCALKAALARRRAGRPGAEVARSVTIQRPRDEVFAAWRRLDQLPTFMRHLEEVQDLGDGRSRWVARLARGLPRLSWEARLTHEEEGRRLSWRSTPGSRVETTGDVLFLDAPQGRGTEVHARIAYRPPGGLLSAAAASFLQAPLAQLVREDLRRFKQLLEAGEVPTTAGQPTCRPQVRFEEGGGR